MNLGTLTCTSLPSRPDGGGQSRIDAAGLSCAFKAAASGHEERYSGSIAEAGKHFTLDAKMVFVWTVLGPKDARLGPGPLAQQYVVRTKGAMSRSPGPEVLVGQENKDIVLQQVSTQERASDTKISSMTLRLMLTPA